MPHGRQLRLFLVDGTSSGPRFYEIVNRTIQAVGIPAIRIKDLVSEDWPEFQKPGVYLVHGTTEEGIEMLYVGKGENVGKRVQGHPDKLDFEVATLLLFSSKDENLNASQVGWLESKLISAVAAAKRIKLANVQQPEPPLLPRAELATVSEFFEDLILIAQTGGYDFFSQPKTKPAAPTNSACPQPRPAPEGSEPVIFHLYQPQKNIRGQLYISDEGFVVKAGSDVNPIINESFTGSYSEIRQRLIDQGVIAPRPGDPSKLHFTIDYAFSAPSPAAAVIVGNNFSGTKNWKTSDGTTLGDYLDSLTKAQPQ
jgi:hypothetical protein